MNICVIPARGGSKRIPRKNIKPFLGRPIIACSIEAAIQSNCFDQIIVSTDDDEIAQVSQSYGAQVPFTRPEKLSDDHTGTVPVVKHAIQWLEDRGKHIENVCCLYATAPFINSDAIFKAFQHWQGTTFDYCFSVTSFPFPIQRAVKTTNTGGLEMFHSEHLNTRSQDLEEAYHDAGQFYWGKCQAFKEEIPIFSEAAIPYFLPRYLVQDIDTEEDWVRAELMYRVLKEEGLV